MCCVLKCSNSVLNPGRKNYSFHRFPKDEILLMKWLENIDRPNFVPTKHTRICSAHFEDWCFQREENQLKSIGIPVHRRSLRPEAVPTLFNVLNFVRKPAKVARKTKKKSDAKVRFNNLRSSSSVRIFFFALFFRCSSSEMGVFLTVLPLGYGRLDFTRRPHSPS